MRYIACAHAATVGVKGLGILGLRLGKAHCISDVLWTKKWRFVVQEWRDYNLAWNESEYGNISSVRLPPNNIWKPDIFMYNRLFAS